MMVNTTVGTPLVRPIRPDRLERGSEPLGLRLEALGLRGADQSAVSEAILSTARLTRSYLDGVRSLLRARAEEGVHAALESLRDATLELHRLLVESGPLLAAAVPQNGEDALELEGLVDVWFRSGGPRELASEGQLRNALTAHLSRMGRIRRSDLAHLACLWSDSQRYHGALRGLFNAPPTRPKEVARYLEAVVGTMTEHVLPVDLVGLPGDPGLLEGIPAMIARLS